MDRSRAWKIGVGAGFLAALAWCAAEAIAGRYFEAVAVSGVASVLAWMALGAGRSAPLIHPPEDPSRDRENGADDEPPRKEPVQGETTDNRRSY